MSDENAVTKNTPQKNGAGRVTGEAMKTNEWLETPQFKDGWWWFYGDEAFGSMNGHFTGAIPPRMEMSLVRIRKISNGLIAVVHGRFIGLTKFDKKIRKEGYVGVWKPAELPEPPTLLIETMQIT